MTSIIVEGSDGHGKSYLARQLSERLGMELFICGPAPATDEILQRYLAKQAAAINRGNVVMDRVSALSHQAYNIAVRKTGYSVALRKALVSIRKAGPHFILCATSEPIHELADYDSAEFMQKVEAARATLDATYRQELDAAGIDYITYDWRQPGAFEQLLDKLT